MRPSTMMNKQDVPDFTGHTAMPDSKDQPQLAGAAGSALPGSRKCKCCGVLLPVMDDGNTKLHVTYKRK